MALKAQIAELIDRPDTFEVVRDQIAAILLVESKEQERLAQKENRNPDEWRLRVFVESSTPWAAWIGDDNDSDDRRDRTPVVNVQFDHDEVERSKSNPISRQTHSGTFFCDCYGYGVSTEEIHGHRRGDRVAAFEAQRAARLVRSILMASHYTYLQMQGVVGARMTQSRTMFRPQLDERNVHKIEALRVAFSVDFNELSPQVKGQPLELISASVFRSEVDGQLLLRADYPINQNP